MDDTTTHTGPARRGRIVTVDALSGNARLNAIPVEVMALETTGA